MACAPDERSAGHGEPLVLRLYPKWTEGFNPLTARRRQTPGRV